jgi:hypothetical protein
MRPRLWRWRCSSDAWLLGPSSSLPDFTATANPLENEHGTLDLDDKEDDETAEEFWQGKLDEIQGVSIDVP